MSFDRTAALPIEEYALIGDCVSAALVARDGSIDWLCWPRFDSAACFAALLGGPEHGHYQIAPAAHGKPATRKYRDGSPVLETVFETEQGQVALIDFMVPGHGHGCLVRIVEGRSGAVDMRLELALRFDYGLSVPWVTKRRGGNGIVAVAGPDMVVLRTDVELRGQDLTTIATFTVHQGERARFVLTHCASHLPVPLSLDAEDALYQTEASWEAWNKHCTYDGLWAREVRESLTVLKCLTYTTTGGIVAAPTTSLPEALGGERNWDYRFCWLRDATLTLFAFMRAGHHEEATAWAAWLHRSVAGSPSQVQIMYGIGGERRLEEWEVGWLPGYQGAKPVRIGNAAAMQLQLDVYGEVCSALHQARRERLLIDENSWPLQREMLEHLEQIWREPDEGLWETRGGRQHFTFSKMMAWLAFRRGIDDAEHWGFDAPLERWRAARDEIHALVCEKGFDTEKNSFVQSFGAKALDASLLLVALIGFLPAEDPRVTGTIDAIERELMRDGFVLRYKREESDDGLPGKEGAFLACSFWLASARYLQGREEDAHRLFERLLALRNDVGLLAEEYEPRAKRFTGNFPQAFSHVALVTTAMMLGGMRPHGR